MMMRYPLLAVLAASAGLAGCATTFNDSAPAADGSLFVVGSKAYPFVGPIGSAWRCPAEPGRGECRQIHFGTGQ